MNTHTLAKTYEFYATVEGGKYHLKNPITLTPLCGRPGVIDPAQVINVTPEGRVHPIACKLCVNSVKGRK